MVANPGDVYNYNSGGSHLLSIILERVAGMSTLEFADTILFKPLDFGAVAWEQLKDGVHDGAGFGLSLQPKDLVKLGQLMLGKGQYNNNQIIPLAWMNKSFNEELKRDTKWGLRNSKHGYGWYSKMNGEDQVLYSMGYGGQFIFVVPASKLVVVTTHNPDTPDGIGQQVDFVRETLPVLMSEYGN